MASALVAFFLAPSPTALSGGGAHGALRSLRAFTRRPRKEDGMRAVCSWPKAVSVIAYFRYRFGRWESVTTHCRSYPNR